MKIHVLTFTVVLFAALGTTAQITPKSYTIGGGFSTSYGESGSSSANSTQQFHLSLSPTFGKFVSEKWLLEGGIGYGYSTLRASQAYPLPLRSSQSFNLTGGITRFFPISERFYFTLGGYITPGYTNTINRTDVNGTIVKDYHTTLSGDVSVTPGLTYFMNKKWMLYSQFGALRYNVSSHSNTDNISHKLSVNLNSSSYLIGVRYVFGGNK